MRCEVCHEDDCPRFFRLKFDPPPSCSICAEPMRHRRLGGPFAWTHDGEIIAWKCEACDWEIPVGAKERRSEGEK